MEAVVYQGWRNQHENHEFPFEGSSGFLPDGLFVDACLTSFGDSPLRLSRLTTQNGKVSGEISGDEGSGFLTFSLDPDSDDSTTVVDENGIKRGTIVFGKDSPRLWKELGQGDVDLPQGLFFSPSCVLSLSRRQVSSFYSGGQERISGIVSLVPSDEVALTGSGNLVVVNAVGRNEPDPCCDDGPFLLSINSVKPDRNKLFMGVEDLGQPQGRDDIRQGLRIRRGGSSLIIGLFK